MGFTELQKNQSEDLEAALADFLPVGLYLVNCGNGLLSSFYSIAVY